MRSVRSGVAVVLATAAAVVLAGAGGKPGKPAAKPAEPVARHATRKEIQALLDHLKAPPSIPVFGPHALPDLRSFPPSAAAVLTGKSAEAAIRKVEQDAGLRRQDAMDLLLASLSTVLLASEDPHGRYGLVDPSGHGRPEDRRRALLEGVVRRAPKSLVAADVLGRCIANFGCVSAARPDVEQQQLAALRSLPRPIAEYWIGKVYEGARHPAQAVGHLAAALPGNPYRNRVQFDHARAACEAGQYAVCLAGMEATRRDRRPGPPGGSAKTPVDDHRSYWRGKALAGLGRDAEARRAFEASLGHRDPRLQPGWKAPPAPAPGPGHAPHRHPLPDDVRMLLCDIGDTYLHQKQWKPAEALLGRGGCATELGLAQYRQGHDFDALVTWYTDLDDRIVLDKARAYVALGATGAARDLLGRLTGACAHPRGSKPDWCKGAAALAKHLGKAPAGTAEGQAAILRRLRAPRLMHWREVPLPEGARPIATLPPPPSLAQRSVVFTASQGDRVLAVSVSGAVDPRGEVSRGGYWVHLSNDGGKHFGKPLYLGFAEGYPYQVVRRPRISPFVGKDLRIEVRRREIDDRHLHFPPIGLRLKSKRDDIYLDIPLAALERDSDGDGLTDLLEEKLVTDPHAKDTDGDGLDDAVDPEPLTPRRTRSTSRDDIVAKGLARILFGKVPPLYADLDPEATPLQKVGRPDAAAGAQRGPGSQRTFFMLSDHPVLPARALPARLIVLDHAEAVAYRKKFGFTAMLRVTLIFDRRHQRALLIYDFGWRGGAMLATLKGKAWTVIPMSRWIT